MSNPFEQAVSQIEEALETIQATIAENNAELPNLILDPQTNALRVMSFAAEIKRKQTFVSTLKGALVDLQNSGHLPPDVIIPRPLEKTAMTPQFVEEELDLSAVINSTTDRSFSVEEEPTQETEESAQETPSSQMEEEGKPEPKEKEELPSLPTEELAAPCSLDPKDHWPMIRNFVLNESAMEAEVSVRSVTEKLLLRSDLTTLEEKLLRKAVASRFRRLKEQKALDKVPHTRNYKLTEAGKFLILMEDSRGPQKSSESGDGGETPEISTNALKSSLSGSSMFAL